MTVCVSVILPTYNRSGSLTAAASSVLSQSFKDLELIVVDDGSTEDIEGLVRRIADPRVRYFRRLKNGGAAAARNSGVGEARGSYVAFQDSDDIWLPQKLERQLKLFSTLPDDVLAVTGGKLVYGRDSRFRYGPGMVAYAPPPGRILRLDEDQVAHLLSENRLSLQNALFHRNRVLYENWFDPSALANEDWDFAIRLAQRGRIYEDTQPVVLGFVSPDSISLSHRRQTIGILRILKNHRILLEKYKTQRSIMMIDIATALFREGRNRKALKFLIAALSDRPAHISLLPREIGRELKKKIAAWGTRHPLLATEQGIKSAQGQWAWK